MLGKWSKNEDTYIFQVTLGLSVFLAFSMFMLLIAEEVPATSEAVPLIGKSITTQSNFFMTILFRP